MKEVVVSSSLPSIDGNFEEVKNELQKQLGQFDLIVDEDSVRTAKSMATQINKLSQKIATQRKAIVAEMMAPIKSFEAKMKELEALCQSSRQNLLSQVKVYDNKRLSLVQELLEKELQSKCKHYGITKEFQTLKIDDLVMLGSLTKGGALTKKAKDTIDERVMKQNEYLDKLTSLIKNELQRLKESEARRIKAAQDAVVSKVVTPQPPHYTQQPQKPQPQKNTVTSRFKNAQVFGKKTKTFKVTATFEVEFEDKDGIEEQLAAMLVHKFRTSGFKQIPTVRVVEM